MIDFTAPTADIRFVLERLVPSGGDLDLELTMDVLGEFAKFCQSEIAPLNRAGDVYGARLDQATGEVSTAPGWRAAYEKYVDSGWGGVDGPVAHGGGGFPCVVGTAMQEILTAANMAFGLAPMLTQGAIYLLNEHGTDEQKNRFLPRMVTGEWTGTMNMTEPHAGSDVGALTSRAEPESDGTWRITGTKIFITFGEHDLAANIVHLVLARTPGAAAGTRGISCFIVPKVLDDGSRNAVRCIGLENKMGIHGSPTCALSFDGAVGWLVGDVPERGMAQMFTMMNKARLAVGVSGLAVAERSYQAAVAYAHERVQRGPIVEHPDVRRMLVHMRTHIDAMRALVYRTAHAMDADPELADLLTPITKAWCTDVGAEVAHLGTQIHGGAGYIAETGVEQLERDVRIASIYEGTNGIQAIDLVNRKLRIGNGSAVARVSGEIIETAVALGGNAGARLLAANSALVSATEWFTTRPRGHERDVLAGASAYLRLWGTVAGGWLLARQALTGDERHRAAACYYAHQVLPHADALRDAATRGACGLFDVSLEGPGAIRSDAALAH